MFLNYMSDFCPKGLHQLSAFLHLEQFLGGGIEPTDISKSSSKIVSAKLKGPGVKALF